MVPNITAMISLCMPTGDTNKAVKRPEIKSINNPKSGEKMTGNKIGRLIIVREEVKGLKVNPQRVFVQT